MYEQVLNIRMDAADGTTRSPSDQCGKHCKTTKRFSCSHKVQNTPCIPCSDIHRQWGTVVFALGRKTSSPGSCFNFRAIKILSRSVSALALALTQTTYLLLQLTDFESNEECLTKQAFSYFWSYLE